MRRKNAWTTYNKKQLDELEKLCKNYLKFLDKGKTERECVKQIVSSLACNFFNCLASESCYCFSASDVSKTAYCSSYCVVRIV